MTVKRFIGDVHGRYRQYRRILRNSPPSIQIGDMGVGFIRYSGAFHGSFSPNPPFNYMVVGPHRFIRGNHDNPAVCKRQRLWIPDGTIENDMMLIGGAVSIDREFRVKDYSWWADEELSIGELNTLVDVYRTARPKIMVTHDCPEQIANLMAWAILNRQKILDGSRSRQAFQSMFEFHQPKLWVFGHWHRSMDKVVDGTRFICLAELEWMDVDLDTLEILGRGFGV